MNPSESVKILHHKNICRRWIISNHLKFVDVRIGLDADGDDVNALLARRQGFDLGLDGIFSHAVGQYYHQVWNIRPIAHLRREDLSSDYVNCAGHVRGAAVLDEVDLVQDFLCCIVTVEVHHHLSTPIIHQRGEANFNDLQQGSNTSPQTQ